MVEETTFDWDPETIEEEIEEIREVAVEEVPLETAADAPVETVMETPLDAVAGTPSEVGVASFLDEPEDSFASLIGTVKTADELLALPPAERIEMVAFLEPANLPRYSTGGRPDSQETIIDTLEHVSNPGSLEVLRRCLDDPDPEIQMYALEAADRLLGVD